MAGISLILVEVNAALCQRRRGCALKNSERGAPSWRSAPRPELFAAWDAQLTVVSLTTLINLPLAQRSAFLAYDKQRVRA